MLLFKFFRWLWHLLPNVFFFIIFLSRWSANASSQLNDIISYWIDKIYFYLEYTRVIILFHCNFNWIKITVFLNELFDVKKKNKKLWGQVNKNKCLSIFVHPEVQVNQQKKSTWTCVINFSRKILGIIAGTRFGNKSKDLLWVQA